MGYGPDLTSEAGAFASSTENQYTYGPDKAFDDKDWELWHSDGGDTQWIGCQITSAAVARIDITCGDGDGTGDADRCPTEFQIRAANSEPTDGATDGTLLYSVTGEPAWDYTGETRSFTFSNSDSHTHYWIYMTDKTGSFGNICEYRIAEISMHALDVLAASATDDAELSGAGAGNITHVGDDSDTASLSGGGAVFDYSAVVNYLAYSVDRYWAVLTGGPDGLTDLEIQISQFSARYQTGRNSYLSVVIPDYAKYISGIEARSNGDLILMAAYYYIGVSILEQELLRVSLKNVNPTVGVLSSKIVLDGYRETAVVGSTVSLTDPTHSQIQAGVTQYSFPFVDFFVRPGDTVTVNDDEAIVLDSISYYVTPKQRSMTIKSE